MMSDSDLPPPSSAPGSVPPTVGGSNASSSSGPGSVGAPSGGASASTPPGGGGNEGRERFRRRLEGVIPEIVRRAVELGVEKARESPDSLKQMVSDLKLPKDVAHYLLQQIDETKNGLFRVVAKEMRDFLEHTNIAGELQKLLTTVQFEVNTTIRFTPNDGRSKRSSDPPTTGKDAEETGGPSSSGESADAASSSGASSGGVHLPRPELRTAVSVRRDDRQSRRRARDA